ncbi:hypothetical protein SDRG_08897 [Saprolegnia diclina VS20]|uniref:FYVE-type domain-containing protein n=1 Tax=Saprolegnia diclina (strain VS20) TaxID=1156394 RepID=T0Q695_SAPDV|nr:hypothetical protein SDRG_08897 [Saprolegnia diclina VS20]EQC33379.1 hypothetical protein SDRG_08897 [Saprolegnia diclina VS20]|eukprot:XP_008613019.1 hypothetical protein SDRG_08897 [Saprolegnia diclina VS20]
MSAPRAGFMSSFDLTREEEAELHEHARSKAPELIALALDETSYEWKKTKYGVSVTEATHGSQHLVRSSAVVHAPAAALLALLESSVLHAYRNTLRTMYQQTFADASVLYHNQLNRTESVGVQWLAFRCGNPLLLDVDVCLVEYMQHNAASATPLDNQRDGHGLGPEHCLGYKLLESIQTKHCPSLLESHRLERIVLPLGGFLLFPTAHADQTRVVFTAGLFQPPAALRKTANRRLLLLLAAALPRLQHAVNATRLGAALASRVPWVPDEAETTCKVCARFFSHLRRKHHCRACGHLICKQCSVFQDLALPATGLTTIRVCAACVTPTTTPSLTSAKPTPPPLVLELETPKKGGVVERRYFGKHGIHLHSPTTQSPTRRTSPPRSPITFLSTPTRLKTLPSSRPDRTATLQALCDLASTTLQCKFAGLSLRHGAVLQHYLKVNQKGKLLSVPSQMGICSPVLSIGGPLLVLDTQTEGGPIEWAKLPIVAGPQRARFYAGAPLVAANGDVLGAICVFDPAPRTSIPPNQLRVMQNLAELTLASLDPKQVRVDDARTEDASDLEAQLWQMLLKAHNTQRQVVEHNQSNDAHASPAILGV